MLEVNNVSKTFPGVIALDGVTVKFEKGEVHALMGENGAGKSTLMKVMTGIYKPDMGFMCIDENKIHFKNYKDSINHDISMVHQEIQVIPKSTVAENIILDKIEHFTNKFGKIKWGEINKIAEVYLKMVNLDVKPTDIIGGMTAAQKQLIQIAKALSTDAQYILMDEPTSSLTQFEAKNLFRIIDKLKKENRCVIFVSHKIEEVMQICDKITVLRDGKTIGTRDCKSLSRQELIKMMIGRDENVAHLGTLNIKDEKILDVKKFCKAGQFKDINFDLHKGEILGLYGLVGAGRTELARLIIGVDKKDSGDIFINGKKAEIKSLQDAVGKYKLGYVTENRKEEGLILSFDVDTNMTLTILKRLTNKFGKISCKKGVAVSNRMVKKLEIKTPSIYSNIENLSGGNQQKVSIGKWLATGCDILIIDEPTVGVDIGAKRHIHDIIWQLAKEEGKSIILISSDMPEIITLARRILVFKDFKIAGTIDGLNEGVSNYNAISSKIGELMV